MNPYRIFKEDGTPLKNFVCGVCHTVKRDEPSAEECCVQPPCTYCGEPVDRVKEHYQKYHWKCWRDDARNREMERLEKATLVEYDGSFLYAEHLPGGREGYYTDMEELLDEIGDYESEDEDAPLVMFAFCTNPQRHDIDLGRVLENACDDGYEDMEDHLSGVEELGAAIDAFNEKNRQALTSYCVDYKRKVAIPTRVT